LSLIGNKLNDIVLNSSNNLVISIFMGLSMVAIYDNYYYVFNAVVGVALIIYTSLTAGLGNSIELETVEKNYQDFKVLTFMNSWFITWCTACLLCLLQPFMEIWVGKKLMFSTAAVIWFAVYFYALESEKIVLTYKDAAGIWWQDRFRPYVVMAVNLILNIVLIQIMGVIGIIIATIIGLMISIPWSGYVLHKNLFKKSAKQYFLTYLKYLLMAVIICVVTYAVCSLVPGGKYIQLSVRLIICCIVPNALFFIFNMKNPEMKISLGRVKGMANKLLKRGRG